MIDKMSLTMADARKWVNSFRHRWRGDHTKLNKPTYIYVLSFMKL